MEKQLRKVYTMKAPASRVWEALTTPEIIQEYFFGTEVISDWKKGAKIKYRGIWEGQPYEEKGIILDIIPEKLLTVNYWSTRSGKEDKTENYSTFSYVLDSIEEGTRLTLVQEDKFVSEEAKQSAWEHWDAVMVGLKKLVENKNENIFTH